MQFSLMEMLGLVGMLMTAFGGFIVIVNRLAKLEVRVDKIEQRLDRVEERLDRLEKKVDEILLFLSQNFKPRKRKKLKHLYRKK